MLDRKKRGTFLQQEDRRHPTWVTEECLPQKYEQALARPTMNAAKSQV